MDVGSLDSCCARQIALGSIRFVKLPTSGVFLALELYLAWKYRAPYRLLLTARTSNELSS
jgi:hypothetical protein